MLGGFLADRDQVNSEMHLCGSNHARFQEGLVTVHREVLDQERVRMVAETVCIVVLVIMGMSKVEHNNMLHQVMRDERLAQSRRLSMKGWCYS